MRNFASLILLIAVLACGLSPSSKAQAGTSDQEIAYLVSQLSWNSVGGECRFYWHIFPAGEAAEKLLEVGKPATDELLKVLEDESRGVAAHLILSQIWEPETVAYGTRLEGDKFIHMYNGLEWADVINEKEMSIEYKVERFNLIINAGSWRLKVAKYRRGASL